MLMDEREYHVTCRALAARLLCPRLPRLGERVVTRSMDDGLSYLPRDASRWTESFVVAEGWLDGVHVESQLETGEMVVRGMYRATWLFAPGSKVINREDA